MRTTSPGPNGVALLLVFGSGCAALAHELLWTRRLVDLLGASAESSTRVFGCFFLGLALGAAAVPQFLASVRRPWRAAALAEAGTAVLALPALSLPYWTNWVWPALGAERLLEWPGAAVKLLLSALVVLLPSICLGMVLPLVAAAVARRGGGVEDHGVRLYACNTLGGAFGLLLVAGVTLQQWGVAGSMWLAIGLNLLVAAGCWWQDDGWYTASTTAATRHRVCWSRR